MASIEPVESSHGIYSWVNVRVSTSSPAVNVIQTFAEDPVPEHKFSKEAARRGETGGVLGGPAKTAPDLMLVIYQRQREKHVKAKRVLICPLDEGNGRP
ncbi:MAG TPA: hypothetical protein V6C72_06145 [Chroococcales cyanobacterium]